MDIIKDIQEKLRSGVVLSPSQYAEFHRILAGEYAFYSDSWSILEIEKNDVSAQYRALEEVKSDAQAERMFFVTDKGKEYIKTKHYLKKIEKMLSSLKLTAEIEKTNWHNT